MKNLFKKKNSGAAGQATPANGGATPGGVTPAHSTPGGVVRTPGGTVQSQTMIVSAHHFNQQQQLLFACQDELADTKLTLKLQKEMVASLSDEKQVMSEELRALREGATSASSSSATSSW